MAAVDHLLDPPVKELRRRHDPVTSPDSLECTPVDVTSTARCSAPVRRNSDGRTVTDVPSTSQRHRMCLPIGTKDQPAASPLTRRAEGASMSNTLPANLLPGAEPWSHEGGPAGALVLHGFTSNPISMRGIADALAAAGFSIEMPLLPGHGTVVEDMIPTRFTDWLGEAEAALKRLTERCEKVVIVGLSMGGSLTVWLGAEHPD